MTRSRLGAWLDLALAFAAGFAVAAAVVASLMKGCSP